MHIHTHPLHLISASGSSHLVCLFYSFNLSIPKAIPGVPSEILNPLKAWPSEDAFQSEVAKLAGMFNKAFAKYEDGVSAEVLAAGPSTSA